MGYFKNLWIDATPADLRDRAASERVLDSEARACFNGGMTTTGHLQTNPTADGFESFTVGVYQASGSWRMGTAEWNDVTDLEQAQRIARRFGFSLTDDGAEGYYLQAAGGRAKAINASLEQQGFWHAEDGDHQFRLWIEAP